MDNGMLSPSDVALLNDKNGNNFGENSFIWIFALLILFGGGNGFGFGNRGGNPVTEADLCNANSFQELKGSVRGLSDQIGSMNVGLTKGLCDFGYSTLAQFNQLEAQLSECCCTTQRAIDNVRFDMANYHADTNAVVTAQTQKILDAISGNRMADMQSRINQLELQSQLCGVVRYPTAMTYAQNINPFCNYGNGCGCQNI